MTSLVAARVGTFFIASFAIVGCSRSSLPDAEPDTADCPLDTADCNQSTGDGCETDLRSDTESCGGCGQACPDGLYCNGRGGCVPGDYAVQIEVGWGRRVVRTANGAVIVWGSNTRRTLAEDDDPWDDEYLTPFPLEDFPPAAELSFDKGNICVRTFDGDVYCRGENEGSIPGAGADEFLRGATRIGGVSGAVRLEAGLNGHCAVDRMGVRKCWGGWPESLSIAAGDSIDWPLSAPVEPRALPGGVTSVQFETALLEDGSVVAWGDPYYDGLPISETHPTSEFSPIHAVPGLSHVYRVYSGPDGYCAGEEGGRVVCWGLGFYAVEAERNAWEHFTAFEDGPHRRVVANMLGLCALDEQGNVTCFGNQSVLETSGVFDLAGGDYSTCIIREVTGTVECSGELVGDGTDQYSNEYVEVQLPISSR